MVVEDTKRPIRSKYQRHCNALIWKSYLQRQRRWRLLFLETIFAAILFLISIFIAKPVFLTPLQAIPQPPLTSADILASFKQKNILGYAPNDAPYNVIMNTVGDSLGTEIMSGSTEENLNNILYNRSQGTAIKRPVIWIIWKPIENNIWKFSIRSTERAQYMTRNKFSQNPHLHSGMLAVQIAVSQAILQYASGSNPQFELSLETMPLSPLMEQENVRRDISLLLLCFTLALLPPVLETQALVVTETATRFKRSLRIRGVDYSAMYTGWLVYAYLTTLPICLLASITLILIFRWVHLFYTFVLVLTYVSVMTMLSLIMAMFHNSTSTACTWTTLFTLLQTFIAELIVHHRIDLTHELVTFFLHLVIPPLGLMHGFSEFALLQTGQGGLWEGNSLMFTILFWLFMIALYFGILMILQRTLKDKAIGGQVSWKSIIFKSVEDSNKLRQIETPFPHDRMKLQEVDELVAKAISIRNVSKSIMRTRILSDITLDIYRGEFTMIYSELIQAKMLYTIEDLLTGLTYPDKGSINILGEELTPGKMFVSMPNMLGYCHLKGCLVPDLTVQEHLSLYCSICLWNESTEFVSEYVHIRSMRLLKECDLQHLSNEYVRHLGTFYRAQLCWAIAILLEPRIIIIPPFTSNSVYTKVIEDKIMQYKKYITIFKLCFTSISLEYADRVFIFDNRILVFGGTPAYMFFEYGREYRVRLSFQSGGKSNKENVTELLKITSAAGAIVRAHLGSLLILRLPASPTAKVAALVKNFSDNFNKYGIISMNISVPDSEEVCNRAIYESRAALHGTVENHERIRIALDHLRGNFVFNSQNFEPKQKLRYNWWKFVSYYRYHQLYFLITVLLGVITGAFIGLSLATVLGEMERYQTTKTIMHGEVLTVEGLEQKTNLVIRSDNSTDAKSIANAYTFSETMATEKEVENMHYTALLYPESLTEYLVTRAIDSPQLYVYLVAYGLDVGEKDGTLNVRVLYSPVHHDQSAAARSLARAYMALLRHYTSTLNATIQVTDDPLALDLSTWLRNTAVPPILIQFLLILTITHITLIPSNESGFIRHMQSHAMDFSPARYWFTLFMCDFVLYCFLVFWMTAAMIVVMAFLAPMTFRYSDLVVVPIMLTIYGIGCIPQAYLFSLGSNAALNTMTFVMVNIILSETTVIAKLFYGNALNYAMNFMSFSPQFNMAITFMKIKHIFLYNSECVVFKRKNLCSSKTLHKCCTKCGILQQCFSKKFYLSKNKGVLMEAIAILSTTAFFMILLLLWEYKYFQRFFGHVISNWINSNKETYSPETLSVQQEKSRVLQKNKELKMISLQKEDTFGEFLLACNLSQTEFGKSIIRDVNFGLRKGEVLAISGLFSHGRLRLCEMLAGYQLPSSGNLWCMSKWTLLANPHLYSRQVTFCCEHDPLPGWMLVRDALEMLAVLRGVPLRYARSEVADYIDALGSKIPRSQPNILYLVHTQEEKTTLSNEGYGSGEGSRILTIHEAQGLTFGAVFIINTRSKMQLHDSVPHAVVAVSRHTESCVYFTDSEDDATGRFIRRAMKATKYNIIEYNTEMAMKDRNFAIVETLLVMIDKNKKNKLRNSAGTQIRYLNPTDKTRLHFAAAVVGAPPVVVLEECTEYQKYSVRGVMYYILYYLKKRGHAIVIGSSSVETHLPVTNRLAILVNGQIYDMDQIDNLVQRYSEKGFTVVVHLKNDVNVVGMFSRYFKKIIINDTSEVLVSVEVLDEDLSYATIFEKMELLQEENKQVYSYVVSATPIDYIYNSIISHESGRIITEDQQSPCQKYIFPQKPKIAPTKQALNNLIPFEKRFHITKLKELPWSVIFNR